MSVSNQVEPLSKQQSYQSDSLVKTQNAQSRRRILIAYATTPFFGRGRHIGGEGGVSQAVRGTQYNQIGPNQIINGKITNEEGKPETDPINVRGIRIQTEL